MPRSTACSSSRMWNEAKLAKVWYEDQPPSLVMRLCETLYRRLTALRVLGYRRGLLRSHKLPVPVVVVGNITAGGTGKTPLVIALVEALTEHGWTPGVVSRGYGGSQREPALLGDEPDASRFGDEPSLMRQSGCALVAVGRDRPAAARLLVEAGADVVIADDGLQHYALRRDIEICVIDGLRRFGNERMLPAGPLREPVSRLQSVDWRVCNGGDAADGEVAMQLRGDQAVNVHDGEIRALSSFARQPVHAVAGIGNPRRFFTSLRRLGLDVAAHPFPDHHAYQAGDLDFRDAQPVLMTDKDAIKCARLAPTNSWRVPVSAKLPPDFVLQLDARLRSL